MSQPWIRRKKRKLSTAVKVEEDTYLCRMGTSKLRRPQLEGQKEVSVRPPPPSSPRPIPLCLQDRYFIHQTEVLPPTPLCLQDRYFIHQTEVPPPLWLQDRYFIHQTEVPPPLCLQDRYFIHQTEVPPPLCLQDRYFIRQPKSKRRQL